MKTKLPLLFAMLCVSMCSCRFLFSTTGNQYSFIIQHLPGTYNETGNILQQGTDTLTNYHLSNSCYKENSLTFSSDSTYHWNDINCTPAFRNKGTWQLFSGTVLQLDNDGTSYNISLSDDANTLIITEPDNTNPLLLQIRTYKRQ